MDPEGEKLGAAMVQRKFHPRLLSAISRTVFTICSSPVLRWSLPSLYTNFASSFRRELQRVSILSSNNGRSTYPSSRYSAEACKSSSASRRVLLVLGGRDWEC